jgi:hypothetical protein
MTAPSLISSSILSSAPLTGPDWIKTTQVLGLAVSSWLLTSVKVNTFDTGSAGVGTITGTIFVLPNTAIITSAFATNGNIGPDVPIISQAIALGLSTIPYPFTGVSPLVSNGATISTSILAPYPTLLTLLNSAFASFLMTPLPTIVNSYALGISNLFLSATGTGFIAGAPIVPPAPASGISVCNLV